MATVTALITYPIKGCGGIELPAAELTPAGLAHDRSFMVIGEDGVFRSQRRDPRLALIAPAIDAAGRVLALRAPGTEPIEIVVAADGPRRPVTLFNVPYFGIDQGDAVAGWLTELLGVASRLVRVPPEHRRVTDGLIPGTSGYADSSPMHILSTESLVDLNDLIVERGGAPLPMNRFRPNIVVTGWGEPYREDNLRRITLGDTEFGYAKPAIRCAVTLVDQYTGARSGPEPLRTLAVTRRVPQGGVAFGSKFAVLRTGRITVGDEVVVTEWAPPRPPVPPRDAHRSEPGDALSPRR